MSNIDHLTGDDWKSLYPNLFPDKIPEPNMKRVEAPKPPPLRVTLDSSANQLAALQGMNAVKPDMQRYMHGLQNAAVIHAMKQGTMSAVCGKPYPMRATSEHDHDMITCPNCMRILNI